MSRVKTVSRLVSLSLIAVATSGFAITEEDSVHSWGPWTTLVQPAAGPQATTPTRLAGPVVPGFGAGDTSQFTPVVTTPTTSNESASSNYALIYDRPNSRDANQTSLQAATATLTPIPVRPVVVVQPPQGDGAVAQAVQVATVETSLTLHSTTSLSLSTIINNVLVSFQDDKRWVYNGRTNAGTVSIQGNTVNIGGSSFAYGKSEVPDSDSRTIGFFIAGDSTALNELDAFSAGEVEATYEGFTLDSGTDVAITVDFGAGTWIGSWNDGGDGRVSQSMSSDGVSILKGSVGFEAKGTIDGANLVSTLVAAQDATAISGTVTGTFFGGAAGALGGSVNVNKTTVNYTDGNYQDLYVTSRNTNLPQVRQDDR